MIYFYWMTGLGFAICLSVLLSCMLENREQGDE